MPSMGWTLDQTFAQGSGRTVRVLQRQVLLAPANVMEEIAPFRCLPTLLKASCNGGLIFRRGVVKDSQFSDNCFTLQLRTDEETGTRLEIRLECVEMINLTVWRVDDTLDALQLNLLSRKEWLYLQTGGDLLLDMILATESSAGPNPLLVATKLFLAASHESLERTSSCNIK